MAAPPKCKVCGSAHWSHQPHVFADVPKTAKAAKPEIARPKAPAAPTVSPTTDLAAYLAAEKAKKAAYMRGYRARTRRA